MRLIDADALIAWIKGSQQMTSKMKCVIAKIETMPTIDAVSVVRCSECRWSRPRTLKGETGYRCVFYRVDKAENGYCDCGERKESE